MASMVYGLFESRERADEAVGEVQRRNTHADVDAFVHEGYMRDEDVQWSGTAVYSWSAFGALVVGLGSVLAAWLMLGPDVGLTLGIGGFFLVFIGGSIFGIVAGSVAGASEAKREIRKMADGVRDGRVLVTMDVADGNPSRMASILEDQGALEVRTA